MKREAFLSRVRSAIDQSTIPENPETDPGPLVPDLPPVDLIERFATALETVSGTLHVGEGLPAIDHIVERYGPGSLLAWDDEALPITGASERFLDVGCSLTDGIVPSSTDGRADHQRRYFDVKYGLTGAEAAFAETGSVVVRSGPGRSRMASLIPLIHVVLLPADQIYRSPMHWLAEPGSNAAGAANVVYITGPSRTADIEQKLTLGVHGPRELHVVLIPA
ncbi:MAG: LUD domain-containing protein [Actinomycetota bacterium]|nr:LUD domain-containing protein [Actinomycetota bacterium]